MPELVIKGFDSNSYISGKITEKYGADFVPDASKMFIPGTPDYQYKQDLQQWENEAQNYQTTAKDSITGQEVQGKERFASAKTAVMTKYNLTEDTFNQEFWSKLQGMDNGKALELCADGLMAVKKLEQVKTNLNNGIKKTDIPTSVTDVNAQLKLPKNPTGYDDVVLLLGKAAADEWAKP
jgi:hypothetical protein